jgi:hypothetical protein
MKQKVKNNEGRDGKSMNRIEESSEKQRSSINHLQQVHSRCPQNIVEVIEVAALSWAHTIG